ncbi:MAG TPA: hypothetical protein VKZ98_02775, partial [Aquaticitalea sp.]|nr:hypothetical protein [Aquaticitalea sp.]
ADQPCGPGMERDLQRGADAKQRLLVHRRVRRGRAEEAVQGAFYIEKIEFLGNNILNKGLNILLFSPFYFYR